ncbi:lipoyl(octanoyl) transferase LipB [Rubrobacter indicoceani]|uniref:lipoyl(octanoyl) transferase LipB n=1 Tax=Rubrobacter indicoceani TaxID=2051957 RepID=UPI00196917AC|nr:lipoyl(octanoyl) transferase LipB [Rubrobacter indicoceani]
MIEEKKPGSSKLDVRRLPGLTPYAGAWEMQREMVRLRKRDEVPDTLYLLEHHPVYTVGRSAGEDASNLGAGESHLRSVGAEVFWSDRGGDATFHGPGQLVGYPIIRLHTKDTHKYLRDLEEVVIRTLSDYGLSAWRHPDYTGAWLGTGGDSRKICAIGVKFSSGWVTSHGFALNVFTDLSWFERITPCGIKEFGVTTLERELGREVRMTEVEELVTEHFQDIFHPGSR